MTKVRPIVRLFKGSSLSQVIRVRVVTGITIISGAASIHGFVISSRLPVPRGTFLWYCGLIDYMLLSRFPCVGVSVKRLQFNFDQSVTFQILTVGRTPGTVPAAP